MVFERLYEYLVYKKGSGSIFLVNDRWSAVCIFEPKDPNHNIVDPLHDAMASFKLTRPPHIFHFISLFAYTHHMRNLYDMLQASG